MRRFVKEFGEGVDRMCKELAESGLPDPEYQVESFMLRCKVRAAEVTEKDEGVFLKTRVKTRVKTGKRIIDIIKVNDSVNREKVASA